MATRQLERQAHSTRSGSKQHTRREALQAAAACLTPALRPSPARRPNILLIIADDLAAWMLGCYGNRAIRTPNLDRLAAEGVRFENGFVCTPICSPSRATLLTGRIPPQTGIHDFLSGRPVAEPPQGQFAPPESFRNETFISDLLAEAGYTCGYSGKWHLGDGDRPQHGYTSWYVQDEPNRYQDPNMIRGSRRVQERGYLADLIHAEGLRFIETARTRRAPWFLTLSHFNPHTPYAGHPPEYYAQYAREDFAGFGFEPRRRDALRESELMSDPVANMRAAAAATTALDDRIGALLDYLAAHRLDEETLILFVGDNGYLHGRHGLWSKGLAAWPPVMYEEVIRVPTIWRWRGRLRPAVRSDLVSFYDVVPTLCELAGLTPPSGRNLCGRSYAPLLEGRHLANWPDRVFGYLRNTYFVRERSLKYVMRNQGFGPNELWDLAADPTEHRNLIDEPARRQDVRRLHRELVSWLMRYGEKWGVMAPDGSPALPRVPSPR